MRKNFMFYIVNIDWFQFVKCHKQLANTFDDSSKSNAISVNTNSCDFIINFALSEFLAKFLRVNADSKRTLFEIGPSSTTDYYLKIKLILKAKKKIIKWI